MALAASVAAMATSSALPHLPEPETFVDLFGTFETSSEEDVYPHIEVRDGKIYMDAFKLPKFRCRGKGAPERLFRRERRGGVQKKPAAKKKGNFCEGPGGSAVCSFGIDSEASHVFGGFTRCLWCSDDRLLAISKKMLNTHYSKLTEEQKKKAMDHLKHLHRDGDVDRPWRCPGLKGEPCVFGLAASGGPSQSRKTKHCIFCDPEQLAMQMSNLEGKHRVVSMLQRMGGESRMKAITERIPAEHRDYCRGAVRATTALVVKRPAGCRASS